MLAIIIPYYKMTFFKETLESLAAQTDKRFTVYIGNDASPENPEDLLKEFEGKFNYTYKKFAHNLGGSSLTQQWERCIAMMQKEEWFMILGDDDCLDKDCVAGFYQTVGEKEKKHKVLRYKFQVIDERKKSTSPLINFEDGEKSSDFIVKRSKGIERSSLSEYVFRVQDYKKWGINAYPKAFYSDNMMVLRYSDFGPVTKVSTGKVLIRISSESITGNKDNMQGLKDAGYLFYEDLLTKYHTAFNQDQKKFFVIHVFDSLAANISTSNFLRAFRIIIKHSTLVDISHYFVLYIKTWAIAFINKFKTKSICPE